MNKEETIKDLKERIKGYEDMIFEENVSDDYRIKAYGMAVGLQTILFITTGERVEVKTVRKRGD
jgi:hypothetical protein